jgi:RNA polymerase sigma-70 factor, ECF subfamily
MTTSQQAATAASAGQEPADEALMLAYAGGDARAFATLYTRHKGGVYRYLLRQVKVAQLADELMQDVWTNLINARERYSVEAKFTTWLYTVAHNRLMDHFRRDRDVVSLFGDGADGGEDEMEPEHHAMPAPESAQPERMAEGKAAAKQMLECLGALPAVQREAFLMQEESGMSLKDIAEAVGVGEETVKSRLRYAMNKLRDCMKAFLPAELVSA